MKRTFTSHWTALIIYFLLAILLLPSIQTHAHHLDFTFLFIFLLPAFFLLWNPLAKRRMMHALTMVVLFLFVSLHLAPFVQTFQSHHQSMASNQHPCCMTQIGIAASDITFEPLAAFISEQKENQVTCPHLSHMRVVDSRAPPFATFF